MKIRNVRNNLENKEIYKVRSILLDDGHFLFRLKKKSTSPTWSYFDAKNNNGITLIALIITIILMLILSAVVLNVTIGENGLFKIAKQATQKYKMEEIREKVEIEIANVIAKETALGNDITVEKILQELIENETFESIDKETGTGIIGDYDIKLKQDEDGNIVVEEVQKATGMRVTYTLNPKGYTNKEEISILFKVVGEVKSVIKPDGLKVYPNNNNVSINYQVNKNGTYKFIVENEEGTTIEKEVIVDTIDKLPPKAFTITASQVENKLVIKAKAEDDDENTANAKSGIDRYEYYVKKSTDTNYPETPYTTNEIEGLEYDTYIVYVKAYDKAGNSIPSTNEATVTMANPKILKYGQKVNYSANGVEDWKIFYINEARNETFIIISGYLPVGKVPKSTTGMYTSGAYGASWATVPSYVEITDEVRERFMMSWNNNKTNSNIKCVSRLLDTDAWSAFVRDDLKDKGATAIGSPTLEMFIASYNEIYPKSELRYSKNSEGFLLLNSNNVDANNSLYVPYKSITQQCRSYYISSPYSGDTTYLCGLYVSGNVPAFSVCPYWQDMYSAIRPVVCIPSDLLEYDEINSSWNVK